MLTVSLHGITIHAPIGMYPEEKVLGNTFEIDVDVWLPETDPWPFADYVLIHNAVNYVFDQPAETLETLVAGIHAMVKRDLAMAEKIRVAVRKMSPPLPGPVQYSQVVYEK